MLCFLTCIVRPSKLPEINLLMMVMMFRIPQRCVRREDGRDHVCCVPRVCHHCARQHPHRHDEQHIRGDSGLSDRLM